MPQVIAEARRIFVAGLLNQGARCLQGKCQSRCVCADEAEVFDQQSRSAESASLGRNLTLTPV